MLTGASAMGQGLATALAQIAAAELGVPPQEVTVVAHHQHGEASPRLFRVERPEDRQRIGNIGATPSRAGLGHLEIAAGRRAPAFHLDSGVGDVEQLSGLMLAENAGDVVIDHHDLVHLAVPLLGEHADRR